MDCTERFSINIHVYIPFPNIESEYEKNKTRCALHVLICAVQTLVGARIVNETDAELAMMVGIWCATENPDFFLRDPSWTQLDEEMKDKRGRPRDVSISSLLTMFPPEVWQSMDGYEKQRLLGVLGLGDARFYDW